MNYLGSQGGAKATLAPGILISHWANQTGVSGNPSLLVTEKS